MNASVEKQNPPHSPSAQAVPKAEDVQAHQADSSVDSRTQQRIERNARLLEENGATWDGIDDPADPFNWPAALKITVAFIIALAQLVCLMSTSMMAAALDQISSDLDIGSSTTQVTFSVFVLGLAFAPFPIAALSELYGRKPVWLVCNTCYMLWNALCPVGNSLPLMVIGRFLAGSGASVGITLTGPVMADMYTKEERGKSLAIATFIPYLGPALGPIIGGLITQKLQWHWLFWILSIFDAGVTLAGCVFVKETYVPVLLRRKAAAQSENVSLEPSPNPFEARFYRDLYAKLSVSLVRPLQMLVHRPIIQVIALIMALNFGVYTLLLSTFSSLWQERYGQSAFISTLHYIAIAIGTTFATQVGGRLMDWIFRRLKARAPGGATTPEFRVPYLVPGVVLIPAGLFWYGWAAQTRMHWVMVDFGVAIFTCGSFILAQGMLAYLLDEFHHAASANAASRMLSNIFGFAFPIFAPQLYARFDYGWGNSLLGFIFVALGCPAPLILWLWGARLRALGRKEVSVVD